MNSYNGSEIETSSSNNEEPGKQVYLEEKIKGKPRWPDFEKSINEAASEGKTCFFEFEEEQEKNEDGYLCYYVEGYKPIPVMDGGQQNYKNFKAFIKKHESDFKKLVRKHDLMLVYLHQRVFLVPTRYLKGKNKNEMDNIIKKMIEPIHKYFSKNKESIEQDIYLFTHGSLSYNPFRGSDANDIVNDCPNKKMALVTSNNCDGLFASEYGMQQRGVRQGRVVNALLNKIADVACEQCELPKSSLHISADSFGNVVNNFIMDQLLNKDNGVLRPVKDGESVMNATYRISAPHFQWPFTPSYEHIYGSLLHHELPSNFTIKAPRPSDCCFDLLHPKCVVNGIKDTLGTHLNTRSHCGWLQNK